MKDSIRTYVKENSCADDKIVSEVEIMFLEAYGTLPGYKIYKSIKRKHSIHYNK